MRASYPLFAIGYLAAALFTQGCAGSGPPAEPARSSVAEERTDERMSWWRDARFGLFIHWGLYAIPAGEWPTSPSTDHGEWIRTTAQIPLDEYEALVQRFDPVAFDADAWARMAKDAGMGYVVITSKHHDGFCLWDSAQTDFDIASTPFKRDVLAELAKACKRAGLRMCWYHSILDWHHPDYLPRLGWEGRSADGADFARYVRYLHAQVEELLTRFGPVGVMWFDGEWEPTWKHEQGLMLYAHCRRLQPDVIVNNRVDKGRSGMAGMTSDARFAGDFGTPEQEIPPTGLPGVDWETCMTMNEHWGYNRRDERWKSAEELVRTLCDVASKGGNFLLNVGPTAEGRFPEACVERLAEIGRWMRVNGDAIHGTRAGPFEELPFGRCTQRAIDGGARLYLCVFDWPADGRLRVPGIGNEPRSARLLAEPGRELATSRDEDAVVVELPVRAPDPICSVVALDVDGPPRAYAKPRIVAPSRILVRELAVELRVASDALVVRYTLDGSEPTTSSALYTAPLRVTDTTLVKARAFEGRNPISATAAATFTRVEPIAAVAAGDLEPGLVCETFDGEWDRLPDFAALAPRDTAVVATVALPAREERIARRFTGFLTVPEDEVYELALTSDDGSRLWIGGSLVADNDGLHVAQEVRGTVPLAAGAHPIAVEWFNKTGGAALELRIARAGGRLEPVGPASLGHRP